MPLSLDEIIRKYGKDSTELEIQNANEINNINVKYDEEERKRKKEQEQMRQTCKGVLISHFMVEIFLLPKGEHYYIIFIYFYSALRRELDLFIYLYIYSFIPHKKDI